ncbi:MAG: hypothetical protein WC797_02030 [Candidatus Paceibacterota bacterium]|jgi:hypothetical protein
MSKAKKVQTPDSHTNVAPGTGDTSRERPDDDGVTVPSGNGGTGGSHGNSHGHLESFERPSSDGHMESYESDEGGNEPT